MRNLLWALRAKRENAGALLIQKLYRGRKGRIVAKEVLTGTRLLPESIFRHHGPKSLANLIRYVIDNGGDEADPNSRATPEAPLAIIAAEKLALRTPRFLRWRSSRSERVKRVLAAPEHTPT